MNDTNSSPVLIVYKEIVAGDIRKLRAESNNDSTAGGGARDLRLPWKTFRPVMYRIFTKDAVGRGGKAIRAADVVYLDDDDQPQTTELFYWPPTTSRKAEDRIAQIHASPALGGQLPLTSRGRVFLLFIKFADGTVRVVYAYEDDLRSGEWSTEVATQILRCMDSSDLGMGARTAQGYYDFTEGTGYCHAD